MIENPTEEQLRTLRGIVYLIENIINGKKYFGETYKEFYDRYSTGRWWDYPANEYLKNSVKKYGKNAFKVSIMESGIETKRELLKLQNKYIIEYNSLFPNGYNFILDDEHGNKVFSEELKLKLAIAGCHGKIYKIKEIATGEIKEFRCPKEIIDKYNIKQQNLHALFAKKMRTIKGICLPETNPDKWEESDELIIVLDQNNNQYKFYNCSEFAKTYGCCGESVRRLKNKKQYTITNKDGIIFRLLETEIDRKRYKTSSNQINPNQKYKQIILTKIITNEDFIINVPTDIKSFCNLNGINKREIYQLTSGEQNKSKGFKLKSIVYLKDSLTQ